MPVPFLIAGRIQNVQTCLFGVFAVQDRQPLEQQVRIINHLAGAAGHDAGGQAAGGNHGQLPQQHLIRLMINLSVPFDVRPLAAHTHTRHKSDGYAAAAQGLAKRRKAGAFAAVWRLSSGTVTSFFAS